MRPEAGQVVALAGLDAGFLVRAEHEIVLAEWITVEEAVVEVEDSRSLGGEIRVAGGRSTSGTARI